MVIPRRKAPRRLEPLGRRRQPRTPRQWPRSAPSSAASVPLSSRLVLLGIALLPIAFFAPETMAAQAFAVPPPPSSSRSARRNPSSGSSPSNNNKPSSLSARRSILAARRGQHHGGGSNQPPPPPPPPKVPGSRHDDPAPNDPNRGDKAVSSRRDFAKDEEGEEASDRDTLRGEVEDGDNRGANRDEPDHPVSVRGGASSAGPTKKRPDKARRNPPGGRGGVGRPDNNNNVVRGTQATLATTATFWSDAFQKVTTKLAEPFRRIAPKGMFKSERAKKQEELLHQLKTMPVQQIRVPNTTVLPPDVIQVAAKRCQMLGNALRMDRVQEFAGVLGRWYARQGYVLHSVTGATLVPETATAEIAVIEPKVHQTPVDILFVKEMVVVNADNNNDNGEGGGSQPQLLTLRQYKDMYNKDPRRGRRALLSKGGGGAGSGDEIRKQDLNTTFVSTSGRVKSAVIAAAMGLRPGAHFSWNSGQWQRIASSPLFARILQAKPAQMQDGTVQLQMIVQEAPLRHLEYGVGKSLYTNSWEGELEFEHLNVLGGGETLGVTVKRGTSEAAPSGKITFGNARFGNPGGYQVQLFRDFLGKSSGKAKSASESTSTKGGDEKAASEAEAEGGITIESSATPAVEVLDEAGPASDAGVVTEATPSDSTAASSSNDDDVDETDFYDRKGLSFRIRNPIPQRIMFNSAGSATVERTTAVNGRHENICSTTLSLGPFVRQLPYDARSNVDATVTTGTRISIRHADDTLGNEEAKDQVTDEKPALTATSSILDRAQFLPYSTVTASMRQIFPLTQPSSRRLPQQQQPTQPRRPIVLALRHSVSTSTQHTPSYEAQALGNSVNIRGGEPNGSVKSCLRGTTELRVPITVPDFTKMLPKIGGGTAPAAAGGDGNDVTTNSPASDSASLSVPNGGSAIINTAPTNSIRQDANVVLFGDWLVAAQDSSSTPLFRKTSVGVGVRKSIQGIPLSLDLTYSKELKFRTSFGLGRDFDV